VGHNGDIFVADAFAMGGGCGPGCGAIIRIDPVTGMQTPLSARGEFARPTGIAIAPDGSLLIADPVAHGGSVIHVDVDTGAHALLAERVGAIGIAVVPPITSDISAPPGAAAAMPGSGSAEVNFPTLALVPVSPGESLARVMLSWRDHFEDSTYVVVRFSLERVDLLPTGRTAPRDSTVRFTVELEQGSGACYLVLPEDNARRGEYSDVLCSIAGVKSDAPTMQFAIRSDGGGMVGLVWEAPPWETVFRLTARSPERAVLRVTTLTQAERSFRDYAREPATCYVLESLAGPESSGTSDELCSVRLPNRESNDEDSESELLEIWELLGPILNR
jgi:hypothetical protein